ncbi:MAG TPA: plastocyanin/azurin family copper-binding protein [Gaiellaceae bacterium]|jgi:uncharacterized cupredoxin-like copper-binding protein
MRKVIALLLVTAAVAGLTAAGAGAGTQSVTATTTIKVSAGEFFFKFSKASLTKPGTVVFAVKNVGHLAHDLKIGGKKTPLIQPGKSASLKVVFTKKGRFTYLCTVPGHAAQGMQGTFVVH